MYVIYATLTPRLRNAQRDQIRGFVLNDYTHTYYLIGSAVFSGGAGGARAPPEFGGSQKGQSLISAYQSLAITTNTPGFEKLNTALRSKFSTNIFLTRTTSNYLSASEVSKNHSFKVGYFILTLFLVPKLRSVAQNEFQL